MTVGPPDDCSFSDLKVYRFILHVRFGQGSQLLPAYLGSTFRGVFAAAFRRVVCSTGAPECQGCLLLHRCSYPYIFATPPPPQSPAVMQKRFRQAPRPYVLQVPRAYDGKPELELGFVIIGKAIDFLLLGRIEALSFFHCGGAWEHDDRLRELARDVQVVHRELSFQPLERYSNRQQRRLPLHGYVGSITFAGRLTEFLPFLRMGEYLHIGAGTAFGLGRYRLTVK